MATVSIRIEGVDRVYKKLGSVKGADYLAKPMQEGVRKLQADMMRYPVAPSGSTYVRTGTLGRRWTTKVAQGANGVTGTVGNNTEYAPWVQSASFQAGIHRGRWQTDAQVLERNRDWIVGRFRRAIQQVLGR